jgi:lysophospholipase L1-like esterase
MGTMTRRRAEIYALLVVVVVAGGLALYTWRAGSPGGDASASTTSTGFYLAIGGSSSLGFQPTGIPAHNGKRTDTGYANDVETMEAKKGTSLVLRQVGCPGERASTMILAHDACYKGIGGQMTASLNYLKAKFDEKGLVTIDLGFNDVRACLLGGIVDEACATKGLAAVREDMPAIVRRLKAAAGPEVKIVGLLYEDPFLSDYLYPGTGFNAANLSLQVIGQLNASLETIYRSDGVAMANVPGGFKTDATNEVSLDKVGTVPQNVASACTLTWMCAKPPWGPDDHPNNAGYRVIAVDIEGALPASW